MRYIDMDLEDACRLKWERGVSQYRKNKNDKFEGDHCEEAFQECIDLHNILSDMERAFGINLQIQKSMAFQIAMTLKAQHRRLTGT